MRRLAFSTLGCPGEPIAAVVDLARRSGCGGVELRCHDGEPVSSGAALAPVREQCRSAGIEIVCVASYVEVAGGGDPVADLLHHVGIAEALGSPFLRVFGGGPHERAVDTLSRVAGRIADSPVTVLLETHDTFLRGEQVAAILAEVGSPRVGALWDAVNPWRAGEDPRRTADVLAPWLRHVQLKDVAAPGDLTPVLPGRGVVPLAGILAELDRIGYEGWLSLEWERAWYPGVPPLDEALTAYTTLIGDH